MENSNYSFDTISRALHQRLLGLYAERKNKWRLEESAEWYFFTIEFITAIEELVKAEKLLIKSDDNNSSAKKPLNFLFFPIIYNFRHTIELTLKTIGIVLGIDSKLYKNHDLESIYNEIKTILNNKNVDKISVGMEDVDSYNQTHKTNLTKPQVVKILKEYVEKIYSLVIKYHHQFPLTDSIKPEDIIISDVGNELFKYPVNHSISIQFKYTHLLHLTSSEYSLDEDVKTIKFGISLFISLKLNRLLNK